MRRHRKNASPILELFLGGLAGAAGLGLTQIAAAHGVIPSSIQTSQVKNGLLMQAEGLAGGTGLYFVRPWVGAGFGMTMFGFGTYVLVEGLLNKAKKPAPNAQATPGTQPGLPQGSQPSAPALPQGGGIQTIPVLGQTSPMPTAQDQVSGADQSAYWTTFATDVADMGTEVFNPISNFIGGPTGEVVGGSSDTSQVPADDSGSIQQAFLNPDGSVDFGSMGALYQSRYMHRLGALRDMRRTGALVDPRRMGALVSSGFY